MSQISVVVPVYNVEKFIERCINSILNQIFQDYDLILVDDGSTDTSGVLCDKYADIDNRIHVIHQLNGGLSFARNVGIGWALRYSNSEWITFVDSDDWIHPEFLSQLYYGTQKYNVGISVCCHKIVKEYECIDYSNNTDVELISVEDFYSMYKSNINIITAWGKLYHKEYFEDIRYPVGKINEDIFTTHKVLVKSEKIALVNSELYYYFMSSDSIMRRKWNCKRFDEIEGYEELITYMDKNNYPIAKIRAVESYYWSLQRQIKEIKQSDDKEIKKYEKIIRDKLRKAIQEYKDVAAVSLKERTWILDAAYPRTMQIYWIIRAVINKIKKVFLHML